MAGARQNIEPPTKPPVPGAFGRTAYGEGKRGFGYVLWKATEEGWTVYRDTGPRYRTWGDAKLAADLAVEAQRRPKA
jgi:hypothetical protein